MHPSWQGDWEGSMAKATTTYLAESLFMHLSGKYTYLTSIAGLIIPWKGALLDKKFEGSSGLVLYQCIIRIYLILQASFEVLSGMMECLSK